MHAERRTTAGAAMAHFHSRHRSLHLAGLLLLMLAGGCRESPAQVDVRALEDARRRTPRAAEPDSSAVLVIARVTVIDPTAGAPQPDMTVVVRGGRIAAVGPDGSVEVPPGAARIDGDDRFLVPGLWDAHAHLSYPGACVLPLMIAHGITSVRDLGGPPAEGVAWRREIAEGRRIGPRLYLAGLNIESAEWLEGVARMIAERAHGVSRRSPWERSPRFKVAGRDDAGPAVDTALRMGMDVVKFRNLEDASFRAVADAARRLGFPLAGHAPDGVTLAEAAEAGLRSLEHGANLSSLARLAPRERKEQYRRIARAGMFVTPTLVSDGMWAPDSLVLAAIADTAGRDDPRRRMLSRPQIEMWEDILRDRRDWSRPMVRREHDSAFAMEVAWVREAHRAGVPLLAGTDLGTLLTFPGASLHEELALLVERVGLTPIEALRSATVLPARFFGLEQDTGTIAAGKHADLVLLRADPLRDIRNVGQIEGVVMAGRYFGPGDIEVLKACRTPGR